MSIRVVLLVVVFAVPGFAQEWNPKLAAQYLDARQKDWFAWPTAQTAEGPCVSCHTGMTYLMVRPMLRRTLHEAEPTPYETGLTDALRKRVQKKNPDDLAAKPTQALGVEAVFSALFLAKQDSDRKTLSADTSRAFDQLWSMQVRTEDSKLAWPWFSLKLDPWEMPESAFYGATLAAQAIGNAPEEYRNRPEIRERVKSLTDYLQREMQNQPLHNRVALLWAASAFPAVLKEGKRQPLIGEILAKQESDGGWSMASLGPWSPHADAPPSSGSNAYATAFVSFVLRRTGVGMAEPHMKAALAWLRSHQDRQSGAWNAMSMNKKFDAGSMQILFMQDAATAFATMALLEGN